MFGTEATEDQELNVLVLHRLGDPMRRLAAVEELEMMLETSGRCGLIISHDAHLPFPSYLREVDFQLIVLGPTFLCSRYHEETLKNVLDDYDFVRTASACKVALPQDDYDCCGILDEWMSNWKMDRLYAVCSDELDILYPRMRAESEVHLGFTGYVNSDWIQNWSDWKPWSERTVDVSYRASRLGPNFGRLGQLKSQIAGRFIEALGTDHSFKLDISTNPKDFIPGVEWRNFLANSKFCLVTPSGSSIIDPDNKIRKCTYAVTARFRNPSFDRVEAKCFPGQDGKHVLTAISPRNIEAALSGTVQIATPGSYSGILKPMEHYIPLEEDCANISEVLSMMSDMALVQRIQRQAREAVLSEPRLRQEVIVDEILGFARSITKSRSVHGTEREVFEERRSRYLHEIERTHNSYWRRARRWQKLRAFASHLGVRRAVVFLKSLPATLHRPAA